jgi:hypothetical protein
VGDTIRLLGLVLLSVLAGLGLTWRAWERAPKKGVPWATFPPLEKTAAMNRQIMAREAIARQVVEKDMTLFEAAAWFRHLNEEAGHSRQPYWQQLPGESDDEKVCRQVLLWVRKHLEAEGRHASEADATARALEKELEGHIAEHGRIILPDGQ